MNRGAVLSLLAISLVFAYAYIMTFSGEPKSNLGAFAGFEDTFSGSRVVDDSAKPEAKTPNVKSQKSGSKDGKVLVLTNPQSENSQSETPKRK